MERDQREHPPGTRLKDVSSIYVNDKRNLATNYLGAVRLYNGQKLPSLGLCVATARPLYIWGHYNQTNAFEPRNLEHFHHPPAMVAGDAITVLSGAWTDANSTTAMTSRFAADTTVNTGIVAGNVATTSAGYSGGMEDFIRFLGELVLVHVHLQRLHGFDVSEHVCDQQVGQ